MAAWFAQSALLPEIFTVLNMPDAKRILEAVLLCAPQPLSVRELRGVLDGALGADSIKAVLRQIQADWRERGLVLVCVASGWRFQTRPDLLPYLERLNPEKSPRYTRATLETLAIIAYRQPVTRADMEAIRGVVINAQILRQLEDRGWIEVRGYREAVGRPALFATTRQFLDDLGLSALDQLPGLDDIAAQARMLAALEALPPPPTPIEALAASSMSASQADSAALDQAQSGLHVRGITG